MSKKKPAAAAPVPAIAPKASPAPPDIHELDEVEAGLLAGAEAEARRLEQLAHETREDAIQRVVRRRGIKGPGGLQIQWGEEGPVALLVHRNVKSEEPRV